MGLQDGLGVGQDDRPLYNYEQQYDPTTGRQYQTARIAGMNSTADPFTAAFGGSVNTMNNLGSTIGNAFGAVNQSNAYYNDRQQSRNLISGLLSRLFGGGGGAGGLQQNYMTGGKTNMTVTH